MFRNSATERADGGSGRLVDRVDPGWKGQGDDRSGRRPTRTRSRVHPNLRPVLPAPGTDIKPSFRILRRHEVEKARYQHLASWSSQLGSMRATVIAKTANGGPSSDGRAGGGPPGLGAAFFR
jgi:hypothetical protein